MTPITGIVFLAGVLCLIGGGEWLVRGASRLAATLGLSPLIIGLTVVAMGTSAPELATNVQATLSGQADIALGNVVGSNIINILLILGVSAAIVPLRVKRQLLHFDVPLMIGISLLVYLLALDGHLGALEGGLLVAGLVAYVSFLVTKGRRESGEMRAESARSAEQEGKRRHNTWVLDLFYIIAGLGLLVLGARWLVTSAVSVARWLGVSELIIGLTVVALGTSLPEVAASIAAALKGERDIAVGNVVGSNLFNLLGALGISALIAPGGFLVSEAARGFDLPVMVIVAAATLPILYTGYMISRWEGWLFIAYYLAYTAYLLLDAAQHDALHLFNWMMLFFAAPLTLITITALFLREPRIRRLLRRKQD